MILHYAVAAVKVAATLAGICVFVALVQIVMDAIDERIL